MDYCMFQTVAIEYCMFETRTIKYSALLTITVKFGSLNKIHLLNELLDTDLQSKRINI